MSRGAQTTFRPADITRALKAVVKAGMKGNWRVEMIDRDGKRIVIVAEPASTPDTETTLATSWDDA